MVYCGTVLAMVCQHLDFLKNVWFSNEIYIHLNGYINCQTTRFLGFEQPDDIVQKPLYSGRVMIWCAISAHGLLAERDEKKVLLLSPKNAAVI
ncbi:hypothetical protein X975_14948, partial [Stegodyphus mimosarum]